MILRFNTSIIKSIYFIQTIIITILITCIVTELFDK